MRRAFGKSIVHLAEKDQRVILIACDVEQEMDQFKKSFPDRFFNLGICELSIISIAAGMASRGLRPFVYSHVPFLLERPFEHIKIDIDEHNLPVVLVGSNDYPSLGPSHRTIHPERIAGCFKNLIPFFPRSQMETEKAMLDAFILGKPCFICLYNDRVPFL